MKRKQIILLLMITLLITSIPVSQTAADEPVVKAVLFFSYSCAHCNHVKYEVLPEIVNQYDDQLVIMQVDIGKLRGQELFQSVVDYFEIPDGYYGVPFMVIGEHVMMGSQQIPDEFPGYVAEALANGGQDWPAVPGLADILEPVYQAGITSTNDPLDTSCTLRFDQIPDKFRSDLTANILAIFVLLLLIGSLFFAIISYLRRQPLFSVPDWIIPVLILIGLIVAIYLSVIELTPSAEAYCGPVGNCNEVQRHDCAKLFGLLPIGLMGIAGYFALASAWALGLTNDQQIKKLAVYAFWGFSLFGVLFSSYLTFLEPFVIGATCLWCITSAVVMLLLLIISTANLTRFEFGREEIVLEPEIQE